MPNLKPNPKPILQGLLGDAGNRRALRRALEGLVRLRRWEQLRLGQALHRVRGACLPALLPPAAAGVPAGQQAAGRMLAGPAAPCP